MIFFSREVNGNPLRQEIAQEDRAPDSPVAIPLRLEIAWEDRVPDSPVAIIKFSNSYHTSF